MQQQVRFWCQGHVHELGGRPGRRRAFRFRQIGEGGRDRQAYWRDCELFVLLRYLMAN